MLESKDLAESVETNARINNKTIEQAYQELAASGVDYELLESVRWELGLKANDLSQHTNEKETKMNRYLTTADEYGVVRCYTEQEDYADAQNEAEEWVWQEADSKEQAIAQHFDKHDEWASTQV